ncbi:MAG: HD domain-containing protein [Longimicrobiales bacterium]
MTGARLPSPADWVRPAPLPWPAIASLSEHSPIVACYAVLHADARTDGSLDLLLTDARERIQARLDAGAAAAWIRPGIYIGVRGLVIDPMHAILQLQDVAPIRVTLDELHLFLPGSKRNAAAMEAELQAVIASIQDTHFRALVQTLLAPDSEAGHGFRLAPAATRNHHAHLGGLLEHTLSVTAICHQLARHYGAAIDRDLLLTGALLHDLGKVREIGAQPGFPYTDEGRLLGHILLGLEMVRSAAVELGIPHQRRLLLEHLIASHQGRYEWQSPREPHILEGLLLHYADDLDAKLAMAQAAMKGIESGWSERDRIHNRDWLRHQPPARLSGTAPDGQPEARGKEPAEPRQKTAARNARERAGTSPRASGTKHRKTEPAQRKTSPATSRTPSTSNPPDVLREPNSASDPAGQPSPVPVDPQTLDMFG